jgi:acid phosphatase (class A)
MILANMVPEKADALFARGREYGTSRILAGVHYPTDTEAGRLAAAGIAAQLFRNTNFLRDFEEAKAELRNFLNSYPR